MRFGYTHNFLHTDFDVADSQCCQVTTANTVKREIHPSTVQPETIIPLKEYTKDLEILEAKLFITPIIHPDVGSRCV